MKDWADKGYWQTDVLAATTDDKDNFLNDMADAYISHQPDWTDQYGTMQTKLPGVDTEFLCFPETTGTIVATSGSANMTLNNANSKIVKPASYNEEWKKVAVQNPYTGFSFDDTDVSAELSAISNVNSQLGMQIMLGKTAQDPKDAVAEYRKQLEAAGRSSWNMNFVRLFVFYRNQKNAGQRVCPRNGLMNDVQKLE